MILEYENGRIFSKDKSGNLLAEITFRQTEEGIFTIDYTFVDKSISGQGAAGTLVRAAREEIERRGGTCRATCSYAKKWLEKHRDE